MEAQSESYHRDQLIERRRRLHDLVIGGNTESGIPELLDAVDAALARIDSGRYGACRVCGDPIEEELLRIDPVVEFCLDHLTPPQARALEEDLELAGLLQREMLPPEDLGLPGWETAYHYRGAGLVSGDYCDLLSPDGETLYFMMGDVAGKGHAAAMLMSHLHASFKSLIMPGADLAEIFSRVSGIFCESSLSTQFATLFCGKSGPAGGIEFCLAGHPPPMLLRGGRVERLATGGLPLGMFCQQTYAPGHQEMKAGDLILLFSDGVTETAGPDGEFFGEERLTSVLERQVGGSARDAIGAVMEALEAFRAGAEISDDVTVMAIRRRG